MRCYIRYIGVIDNGNNSHYVSFEEGLNIITGRSSTGKSAIIEIFDYCTGSHNNTIPVGVITDNAQLYFVVLARRDTNMIIARTQVEESSKVFFKFDPNFNKNNIGIEYFSKEYFVPLQTFLQELEHFCGLDISDTDETIDKKQRKGRPSFRNMVSFMLQPQHLIANKYALFYRFDEKEKRERVIDEFKIFSGIVDQQYYTICQELEEKRKALEACEREASRLQEEKNSKIIDLDNIRQNYACVSGVEIFPGVASEQIINAPKQYLDQLEQYQIEVDEDSEKYKDQYTNLEKEKNNLLAKRRRFVVQIAEINSSIKYARQYGEMMDKYQPATDAITEDSQCPFCHSIMDSTRQEANRLTEAINWLNSELSKSPLRMDSFLPERKRLLDEIVRIDQDITSLSRRLKDIAKVNERLEKNQSLKDQSLRYILKIENILEWAVDSTTQLNESKMEQLKGEISSISAVLDKNYNVEDKLQKAEAFINKTMNQIGNNLDFETSFKPIQLHFDIHTFELYHQKNNGGKVYLRSMGSGANWLYSHICLFLALLRYFAALKNSTVPTILFIDQPSQVYFPSILDTNEKEFNAKELKRSEKEADDDMRAVTNLYTQILNEIEVINEKYGYRPQIIISDHADRLNLGRFDFEGYVRARWRKPDAGFIDIKIIEEQQKQA